MYRLINSILFILLLSLTSSLYAVQTKNDISTFEELFSNWTYSFNHKDISKTCGLFSTNVIANYQGIPQKNYSSICNGFRKIFKEKHRKYQYKFKLHNIYHSQNLAAVRITWYLYVYENNKQISVTQDEGIDILEKNKQGKWQIINYLAYENQTLTKIKKQ